MGLVWLIWKEFREHVWKMVGLAAIILPVVVAGIVEATPGQSGAWESLGTAVWYLGVWVIAIWMAAFTISGERMQGTEAALAVLPARRWKVYAAKTFWGAATFVIPLGLSIWLECGSLLKGDEWHAGVEILAGGAMLYTLIVAVGVGIRRHGMALMAGVLVFLGCGIWLATIIDRTSGPDPYVLFFDPLSVYLWPRENGDEFSLWSLGGRGLIAGLYWFVGMVRYQRQPVFPRIGKSGTARIGSALSAWVDKPFRHPFLWKEYREQRRFVVFAAMVGVGLSILFVLIGSSWSTAGLKLGAETLRDVMEFLRIMGFYIPVVVAGILGIASMSGDAGRNVSIFWRSGPIRAGQLFWTKYGFALLGLVVLVAFFEAPSFLFVPVIDALHPRAAVARPDESTVEQWLVQLMGLWICLSIACLLGSICRRSATAGVLFTLIVVFLGVGIMAWGALFPNVFVPALVAVIGSTVVCMVAARVAFGRGWRVG